MNWLVKKASSVCAWVGEKVGSGVASVAAAFTVIVGVVFGESAMAADTIPTMPVDFSNLATEAVVVLGTVMAAIAGIICIIALVRMGFRFLSRALSGSI